jgi:hypothetical protein
VWTRTVRASAGDGDVERVRRRGESAFLRHHLSHLEPAVDVASKDRAHRVQRSALDHLTRALTQFFGWLKYHKHVTARGRAKK